MLHMVMMQRNTPLHGCIVRPRKSAGKHMCSAIDTPCQPAVIAQPKHHCTEPSLHDAIFVAFLVRLLLTTSLSAECYLRVNCRMRCRAMTNPMLWVAPKTATNCDPTHSRADLHCQHYPFLSTRVRLTPHRCLPCIQLACTCMLAAACSCCFSAAASAAAYAFAAALLSASASAAAIAACLRRAAWICTAAASCRFVCCTNYTRKRENDKQMQQSPGKTKNQPQPLECCTTKGTMNLACAGTPLQSLHLDSGFGFLAVVDTLLLSQSRHCWWQPKLNMVAFAKMLST